ncbi:MAG: TIR domain-containing protein, partial [Saprospiraceae bacterium]|nr:TIR domain-containing protein [Saprospiraceae bacterium]
MEHPPLKTFIIYAREDRPAVDELRKHLALLEKKQLLELWFDGEILAGENWDRSIKRKLEQAELVLLLISVDFINSEYIEKTELTDALQRHRDGLARLIPIIVHPCDWTEYFEIGQFQALPNRARPIYSSHFQYLSEAYHEIQQGIKRSALDWLEQRTARRKAESEAAEQARREQEDRLTRAREAEQKALAEQARTQRLHQLDEAAWATAVAEAEAAENISDQIIALETYLDDLHHTLHRSEAESRLAELKAIETKRRIDEKKRAEAQRKAEEETRPKAAAEKERQRQAAEAE